MIKNTIIGLSLITLICLIVGELDLFVGLFFLIIIFIPLIYLSYWSNSLIIITFILSIFFCLYFSFLFFYMIFDEYSQFISFSFNDIDQLKIFVKLGLISLIFVIFGIFFHTIIKKLKFKNSEIINNLDESLSIITFSKKKSKIILFLIFFFLTTSIPMINMMIELGIGVTGARPTALPFKLTGILTLFYKMFLPLFLGVLYLADNRRLFSLLLLSIFVIYGGVHLSSKTIVIATLIIPLIFAFYDKRFFYGFFILILISFSIELITLSRPYLYTTIDKIIYVNKNFNIVENFQSLIQLIEPSNFAKNIFLIFDRILSFKGLYIASKIPASDFISGFGIWLHTLDWGLFFLPVDEFHYMSLGYNVAFGSYNLTADLLTQILWSIDDSYIYAIFITATYSFIFVIIETVIIRFKFKYNIVDTFSNLIIIFFSLSLLAHPGYPLLKFVLLIFIFLNLFPRIKQLSELFVFLKITKKDNNKK